MSVREGKLTYVAKTGGIKMDNEETWINPNAEVKKMISKAELNMEAMKKWVGQRVVVDLDPNGFWFGCTLNTSEDDSEEIEEMNNNPQVGETESGVPTGAGHNQDIRKHIIKLQGKDFITHAGLLEAAHKKGLKSIKTELLHNDSALVLFKATVIDTKGNIFVAHGDATEANVGKNIKPHIIRMAETRAVNRALRFMTNIGMTSKEELSEEEQK